MFIQGSTMGAMTSPTRMPAPPVMAAAAGRFRWNNSWRVAVGASNRLTREVRAAKITAAKERIKSLEAKKQEILAPKAPRKPRKTKKQKIQEIVKLAMKNGMSVEEVASQLHVEVES